MKKKEKWISAALVAENQTALPKELSFHIYYYNINIKDNKII